MDKQTTPQQPGALQAASPSGSSADGAAFRIVSYSPERAASLADMWNRSADNWGGGTTVHTEAGILEEHVGSINLMEFLAVDAQDEVIGFCSFSRYAQDTGALYIPLLNVRPDWHGRKVGKALVLAAVKKTVEMGWPRLDLYTWPGNTKAVPTYKKCGFFWERRDDTTHLMNFIPTVLATPWLEPFFQEADWYGDAVRDIRVEPDGREENGFHFFEYVWNHNGRTVRAEFERTGRGLRRVETETFSVALEMDTQRVVSNVSGEVRIHVRNKGEAPLSVAVSGVADGPVTTRCEETAEIPPCGERTLVGHYVTQAPDRPQNRMKTHPCVAVAVTVNGIPATLRLGVEIRPPALIHAHAAHVPAIPGMRRDGWLDVENCFTEPVTFEFALPQSDLLTPETQAHQLEMAAGEKRTVSFVHAVHRNGFWSVKVPVTAIRRNGDSHAFDAALHLPLAGYQGRFFGEDDQCWFMVNGPYTWQLQKDGGTGTLLSHGYENAVTRFDCPSLGKPFSNEFKTQPAARVAHSVEADMVTQQAEFVSLDFPGLTVVATVTLWSTGELSRTLSVRTDAASQAPRTVSLADTVRHDLRQAVIPYDGLYLEVTDENEENYELYEAARLTENWIFSRNPERTRGLCWSPERTPALNHGLVFTHELTLTESACHLETPPIRLVCGLFARWQDFRHYVRPDSAPVPRHSRRMLRCLVGQGNPFHAAAGSTSVEAALIQHKNESLEGTVEAFWEGTRQAPVRLDIGSSSRCSLTIPLPDDAFPSQLRLTLKSPDSEQSFRRCVFRVGGPPVACRESRHQDKLVWEADNGPLAIGLAPAFSHALTSLRLDGLEWLDTTFPTPGPRSWWGSWPGGLSVTPWDVQFSTAHAGERSVVPSGLTDCMGNRWEGLAVTWTVGAHPRLEALTLTTWYLMLPGTPVLAVVTGVNNGTGRCLNDEGLGMQAFFRPAATLQACWFEGLDSTREPRLYRGGLNRFDISTPFPVLFGADGVAQRVQPVVDLRHGEQMAMANTGVLGWQKTLCITASHGSHAMTDPVFLVFTPQRLTEEALTDLRALRFEPASPFPSIP